MEKGRGTENMFLTPMNDRKAYQHLLKERQCVRNRISCEKNCSGCPFSDDITELGKALDHVIELLKSRCPELYFVNELESLKALLDDFENKQQS